MGSRQQRQQQRHERVPAATAAASALALLGLFLVALAPSPTAAVRIAFVGDTGIGNDNPGDYWVDFYGNRREPVYKVNGHTCYDYKGEPCRLYSRARDVVSALRDNGAELVVHAGDMDYESSPKMWRHFVDETIRNQGMDYVASKGNHDEDGWDGINWLWSGSEGYAAQLKPTTPYGCEGTYGEDMVCNYKGVTIVLSSVGVERAGESANAAHYEYLDRKLSESKSQWKICVWHMTMGEMQVSYKGDSVGWGAYEICRKHGAFIITGHAHTYSRTHEMARFGTKKYSHTYQDLVVSHKGDNRIHLSPGENGTSAVAVVGIGGYKNEEQLRTGNHWAKIYSSECLPGDEVCEVAPTSAEFGALICDFNDFKPDAEAECWTVTTVGKNATIREKRRSYRNPVDRFFLVAGERPGGSKEGRTEVFINEATANDVANKSRGLGGRERRNANRRSLKRSNCTDVQPPPSGGVSYSCAQQKEWGKCDSWFMKNGRLCDRTCGRCVDIFEDFTDDYEDYLEVETAPAEAPTSSAGDSLEDEMDVELIKKKRGVEEETDDDDATTAPAPAPAPSSASDGDGVTDEEEIILGADAAPAPSPTADENDELMLRVDFDGVADDVLAGGAEDTRGTLQPSRRRAVAPSPAARGTRGTRGGV